MIPADEAALDPDRAADDADDRGPVGIFPSWRALYATVVIYAVGLIALFYVLSEALSFSAG